MTPKKKSAEKTEITKKKRLIANVDVQQSGFLMVGVSTSAGKPDVLLESEERYRLFQGILQSTSDGILAVNQENAVLFANERFVEMWMIPLELMAKKDDTLLLRYVLDQLSDPPGFLQKVQELYNSVEESFDTLYFKDDRVFERLSRPLLQGKELRGRVWSFRDITEHKHVEENQRKSEERFRTILEDIEDGYYEVDLKGNLTFVNPAYVKMLGYDENELIGMPYRQYMSRETAKVVFQTFNRVYKSGIPEQAFDWEWIRKDGTLRSIEISISTIKSADESIVGFRGIVRDVTERKQAEMLREVLLEIMGAGVTTKDLQDFLSLVHRSIAKVFYAENFFVLLYNKNFGWFEEIYSVDKFDPPGPPSWHEKSISAHIFRTGQPLLLKDEQVFNELVAQGKVELVGTNSPSWMGVPLKTSNEIIGVMVVQDYDTMNRYSERDLGLFASIAGQVALVVERKRAEETLAGSEAELRTLFSSMKDVVLVIDREGFYRQIAPTNLSLLVKPPDELLGKNLKDIFPTETAGIFHKVIQKVLDTKQAAQIEYELVIGERTTWFQTTVSYLYTDNTLWVAHDITNRKQIEEALRIAEANYRSLFENATIGIYQSTPQGSFMSVNPAMARILGFDSPEEVLNSVTNIGDQFYVDATERHEFHRLVKEHEGVREFASLIRRKDGAHIWVQENARAVKDAQSNIQYYEGFATDITERKQAEVDLRAAKEALEFTNIELRQSLEREKQLASTDGLTALYNRRYLFELAAREFHVAVRYQHPLVFLMFDVDGFKQVNDTLGHSAGDKLLVKIAQVAVAKVRASDVVARYGGDEFIIMMPHSSIQQALPVANRIRASVADISMGVDTEQLTVTLSIGIAEMRHEPLDEGVERVIQRADEALYKAKQSGRNRIVIFGQDENEESDPILCQTKS